jgi:hypothetical protein
MGTSTNLVPSLVAYREARLKTECALPCDKTLCINNEKRTEYFFRSNLLDRQAVACAMSKRLETKRENLDLVIQDQVDIFNLLGKLMGTSTDLVPSFVAYREARLKTKCALPCDKTICISYKKRTEYFFRTNLLDRQAVACAMSKKLETN